MHALPAPTVRASNGASKGCGRVVGRPCCQHSPRAQGAGGQGGGAGEGPRSGGGARVVGDGRGWGGGRRPAPGPGKRPPTPVFGERRHGPIPQRPATRPRGTATPERCSGKARPQSLTFMPGQDPPTPERNESSTRLTPHYGHNFYYATARSAYRPYRTPSRHCPRSGAAGVGCTCCPAAACTRCSSRRTVG